MNGPTKRQHYVWRNYLAAWTKTNSSNGQIMCLRDKKFFPVSLMKIAQENCFYGVKELSQQERAFIYETMVRNTSGTQRKVNGNWLDLYCAPFDLADELSNLGYSIFGHTNRAKIVNDQNFKNWNINYLLAHFSPLHFCRMIPQDYWEEIGRVLLLNAKFPYVRLSTLKTINKLKATAKWHHLWWCHFLQST